MCMKVILILCMKVILILYVILGKCHIHKMCQFSLCNAVGWIVYCLFSTQDQRKRYADRLLNRLVKCRGCIPMN